MGEDQPYEERHLSRNVPRDFNACLERERVATLGDKRKLRKPEAQFVRILRIIRPDEITEGEKQRLYELLSEIRLRYLVLSKTLDQSIPPTPIMRSLKSLRARVKSTAITLTDVDRDTVVRETMGLQANQPFPNGIEAFQSANTIAERASIARQVVQRISDEIGQMAEFFDYKAQRTPRGNQTQFGLIYAINALAAFFDAENDLDRTASINRNVPRQGEDDPRFTGPFLAFVTEFFHLVDDSLFSRFENTSFRDRVRRLTIRRKGDPDLHELLASTVSVEQILEFMKRAENIR